MWQNTAVSTLTFRMTADGCPSGDPNFYNNVRLAGLGAFLAGDKNQTLAIDGTYNIFYQETTPPTGPFNSAWTDHVMGSNGAKPATTGVCTWSFSQAYEIYGFMLTQYDMNRYLDKARLEVSLTGGSDPSEWTSIMPANLYYYPDGSCQYKDGRSYIKLADPVLGQYVRLTWDNTNNTNVEISEFQLFGKPIPEPATMTLLALGGVALLRRRR